MPQDKKFINQTKLQKDLKFGLGQEVIIKDVLEKQFDTKLRKLPHFDPFDFIGNNCVVEIKSRRIRHNQYDTIFFGLNKLKKGKMYLQEKIRVYFVFNCNDGIYYWELYDYDKQINKEFIFAEGGREDRNCNEKEILVNLNTNLLKLID
tara:strand:- start:150 stop:596 length:447 start_codon:yes stop_codon:yes gene_type:complete